MNNVMPFLELDEYNIANSPICSVCGQRDNYYQIVGGVVVCADCIETENTEIKNEF